MRILLTGAAGNLGSETLPRLLDAGHAVRTFDLDTPRCRTALEPYAARAELLWGDLRDPAAVEHAVSGVEVVLHHGAVTPPFTDLDPLRAKQVNLDGTRHLIAAALRQPAPPRILYPSSIAVFGITQDRKPPPLRGSDPLSATDHYSGHKIIAEDLLRRSGLDVCIFRLGVSLPRKPAGGDPAQLKFLFQHSLESRVEFVHPEDVAEAQLRALTTPQAWGKTWLIGGGTSCQLTQRDMLGGVLDTVGIGRFPDSAFAPTPLYGDWLDTSESQGLLRYQRRTFADFLAEIRGQLGFRRWGMGLMAPLVRRLMLRYSDAYSAR